MKKKFLYIIITLLIICIDQISKIWIQGALHFGKRIDIINGILDFTYVENSGGALGILGDLGSPYRIIIFSFFSIGAIILIIYYIFKLPLENRSILWGFSLILSGALGNFIDRLRLSYVIDFIHLHVRTYHWPTFNIADIAICIGLVFIAIGYIRNPPKENKDSQNAS